MHLRRIEYRFVFLETVRLISDRLKCASERRGKYRERGKYRANLGSWTTWFKARFCHFIAIRTRSSYKPCMSDSSSVKL